MHHPVLLKSSQRLSEHLLRDAGHCPAQLAESIRLVFESANDEHRPLRSDEVEYVAAWAIERIQVPGVARRLLVGGFFRVPSSQRSAFL